MMTKCLSFFLFTVLAIQVQALTDEAKLDSFEGSGSEILLSDDEDFEGLLSASGMPPIDENPVSTIETIVEPSPEYEDEPEVLSPSTDVDDEEDKESILEDEEEDLKELGNMTKEAMEEKEESEETEEKEMEEIEKSEETEEKEMEEIEKSEETEEKEMEESEETEEKEMEETAEKEMEGKEESLEEILKEEIKPELEPGVTTTILTTTTKAVSKEPEILNDIKKDDEEKEDEPIDVEVDLAEQGNIDKELSSASIFSNNQFLVAIIIGGCIGLLFAVCVILLVVYRLKKKDEGSYALDEQKKLSSPSYQYTQGQEYFA